MAAMLAIASLAHAQKSLSRDSLKGVEITVRGCVKPGINAGTVVLDHVVELAPDGRELPPVPRGLPTAVYLFNDARRLLSHAGQIVDVRGRIKDVRDSFIDLKPGPAHDDTSIADIHVPGENVHATLDEVPVPVATAGMNERIATVVLSIDVDSVTQIATCASR